MSDSVELLVVPMSAPESLALALARVEVTVPGLWALILTVPEARATAVQLTVEHGRPADLDPALFARVMSVGGHTVGVARVDPVANHRSWQTWRDGVMVESVTPDDELYVPYDDEGFPSLEVPPRRAAEGIPEGWRRLRSALDIGMQRLVSCRFTPVAHALERLRHNEEVNARAYALVVGGRALHPPAEISLVELFR